MKTEHHPWNRRALKAVAATALLALSVALVACRTVGTQQGAGVSQVAPITQGQKYVMATHSFNVFIGPSRSRDAQVPSSPGPLAALAAERGKAGHENLAVQMIGGSTPLQHWKQALRKEIVQGNVPGITRQSEIFRDGMGHPTTPLANVVTYTWYAAMYRDSPIGLTALIDKNDPNSAPRELILQQIAWNAVIAEPMSGVKGKPVAVGARTGRETVAR